jgi:hypothetical protein
MHKKKRRKTARLNIPRPVETSRIFNPKYTPKIDVYLRKEYFRVNIGSIKRLPRMQQVPLFYQIQSNDHPTFHICPCILQFEKALLLLVVSRLLCTVTEPFCGNTTRGNGLNRLIKSLQEQTL